MLGQTSLECEKIAAFGALERLSFLVLVQMDVKKSCSFENLVALRARFDFSVKVDEAVNSQLFLQLKIYVALLTLKAKLFLVLVRNVLMVVSSCLAAEESGAIYKG